MSLRKDDIDPYDTTERDAFAEDIVRVIQQREKNWQREVRRIVMLVHYDGVERGIAQRRSEERVGQLTYGLFVALLEDEVHKAFRVKVGVYNEAIWTLIDSMPSQEWRDLIRVIADYVWKKMRDNRIKEVAPEHLQTREGLTDIERRIMSELEGDKVCTAKQIAKALGLNNSILEDVATVTGNLRLLQERGLIMALDGRGPTRWTIPV